MYASEDGFVDEGFVIDVLRLIGVNPTIRDVEEAILDLSEKKRKFKVVIFVTTWTHEFPLSFYIAHHKYFFSPPLNTVYIQGLDVSISTTLSASH